MNDSLVPVLLILGLGGVALWFVLKDNAAPPATAAPCGIPISAKGVGTVIPCSAVKAVAKVTGKVGASSVIQGKAEVKQVASTARTGYVTVKQAITGPISGFFGNPSKGLSVVAAESFKPKTGLSTLVAAQKAKL